MPRDELGPSPEHAGIDEAAVRQALERVASSGGFASSQRMSRLLRFTVERALEGRGEELKEYLLGTEVFDRSTSFDPRLDPIVRVEARRLRSKLARYYETDGRGDEIVIEVPTGEYLPRFRVRGAPAAVPPAAPPRLTNIAPPPFANLSPDPDTDCLSEGLTEESIHALTTVEGLRVPARLVDTGSGYYLWSENFDRRVRDLFAVQEENSAAIAANLRVTLLGTPAPARRAWNLKAYDLYLRGRFHWSKRTREGFDQAIRYFEEAIAADPDFARGHAGLADVHSLLAEAHTSLGLILSLHEWQWRLAGEHYRRAIDLNPGYVTAHRWYGCDYLAMLGRFDEALARHRQALEHRPEYYKTFDGAAPQAGALPKKTARPAIEVIHVRVLIAPPATIVGRGNGLPAVRAGYVTVRRLRYNQGNRVARVRGLEAKPPRLCAEAAPRRPIRAPRDAGGVPCRSSP